MPTKRLSSGRFRLRWNSTNQRRALVVDTFPSARSSPTSLSMMTMRDDGHERNERILFCSTIFSMPSQTNERTNERTTPSSKFKPPIKLNKEPFPLCTFFVHTRRRTRSTDDTRTVRRTARKITMPTETATPTTSNRYVQRTWRAWMEMKLKLAFKRLKDRQTDFVTTTTTTTTQVGIHGT